MNSYRRFGVTDRFVVDFDLLELGVALDGLLEVCALTESVDSEDSCLSDLFESFT